MPKPKCPVCEFVKKQENKDSFLFDRISIFGAVADSMLMRKLLYLYSQEINFSISVFWDGGWDWELGDDQNGIDDKGNCDTLGDAIKELCDSAVKRYPKLKIMLGESR